MSVHKFSTTPGSNTVVGDAADSVGVQEGMSRGNINNAIRTLMADIAKSYKDHGSILTTGTSAAIEIAALSDFLTYETGLSLVVRLHIDPSTDATITLNNLGPKNLRIRHATGIRNVRSGDLKTGELIHVIYDGTAFHVLNAFSFADFKSIDSDALGGVAAEQFYRRDQGESIFRMGTNDAGNFDGLIYDDVENVFKFWADQDATTDIPVLSIDKETGIEFNGLEVWHAGNDGSGSGMDSDLLDGIHGSGYARANQYTDGWVWVRRASSSSALFATQQSSGPIASFHQGLESGAVKAYITNQGAFQNVSSEGVILKVADGGDLLEQMTGRGGIRFGHDDRLIIGAGESATVFANSLTVAELEEEKLDLLSDNEVTIRPGRQTATDESKNTVFQNDGVLVTPEIQTKISYIESVDGDSFSPKSSISMTDGNITLSSGGFGIPSTLVLDNAAKSAYSIWNGQISLGKSDRLWRDVWSDDGSINTSDQTKKEQQRPLNEAELRVAKRLHSALGAFKWISAVKEKGERAKWHIGIMAQRIEAELISEGLDPNAYGMLLKIERLDDKGNETGIFDYSVRPTELLFFIISAMNCANI